MYVKAGGIGEFAGTVLAGMSLALGMMNVHMLLQLILVLKNSLTVCTSELPSHRMHELDMAPQHYNTGISRVTLITWEVRLARVKLLLVIR